jgi:hypothetical protein
MDDRNFKGDGYIFVLVALVILAIIFYRAVIMAGG